MSAKAPAVRACWFNIVRELRSFTKTAQLCGCALEIKVLSALEKELCVRAVQS